MYSTGGLPRFGCAADWRCWARGERRFLGEGDMRGFEDVVSLVEAAPRIGTPRIGTPQCSVRGFYGGYTDQAIIRLGCVWGRG